jgi:hypothetical protein
VPKDGARFTGEDYSFCDDYVERYGEGIPVWPNLTFTHGGYTGNLSAFLEKQKDLAYLSPQAIETRSDAA